MLQVQAIITFIVFLVCGFFKQVNGVGCPGVTYDEYHKVLILGGGMSGIAAGSALRDNGIEDFSILEGYSKVGGRLRKMNFAGGIIELGANWIQGDCQNSQNSNCNPIIKLANSNMLRLECRLDSKVQNRSEIIVYDQNGNEYNDPKIKYPEDELDNYCTNPSSDVTVREALNNIPKWTSISDSAKKKFVDWYNHDSCFAAPPEETSLCETHPLPTYDDFGELIHLVTDIRGYESILSCILATNAENLRLNTIVKKIRNNSNCVCVDTVHSENSSLLKTYCGEYAIVTFSIGMLQAKHNTLFEPELSKIKVTAINSFTMPLFLKIYLNFDSSLWEVSKHINGSKNGHKDISMYDYIGYASETRGYYPLFVPMPNNVLMAVVTHPFADQVSEQNENITKQKIMLILRQIYGNIPDPDQMYIHHWETDPLFLGTYSNTPVGVTDSTHKTLAEQEGRLFFAGEAASAKYSGFVHGAYFAGIDSGNMVAAAFSAGSTTSNPCTKSDGVNTKQC